MTKEKALYQAKLIIEQLPKEEYDLLPVDKINYINDNCKYDEKITINPDIPLSEQKVDKKTIQILEELLDNIDYLHLDRYDEDIVNLKVKLMNMENEVNALKESSHSNMEEAKKLAEGYKSELEKANIEILNLKKSNQELYAIINKIPKFLRRIFTKEDVNNYYLGN